MMFLVGYDERRLDLLECLCMVKNLRHVIATVLFGLCAFSLADDDVDGELDTHESLEFVGDSLLWL